MVRVPHKKSRRIKFPQLGSISYELGITGAEVHAEFTNPSRWLRLHKAESPLSIRLQLEPEMEITAAVRINFIRPTFLKRAHSTPPLIPFFPSNLLRIDVGETRPPAAISLMQIAAMWLNVQPNFKLRLLQERPARRSPLLYS